jgi:hypothetical protein
MTVFEKLDAIRTNVDRHRVEPLFSEEVTAITSRYQTTISAEENNLLRVMAKMIAYSNNAPSDKVSNLLDSGCFEEAFHGFDLSAVAKDNPEKVIANHWSKIRAIRFKKKIGYIIDCAKVLQKQGGRNTIESLYQNQNLPVNLTCSGDIDIFWQKFDLLLDRYQHERMPYFKNMTTLLHLLLHIGFPCVKPDLIVMRTAAQLGLVQGRENHNQYRPDERRLVVRTIQEYGLSRAIHPAVIDRYLLVHGGQRVSVQFVDQGFMPSMI